MEGNFLEVRHASLRAWAEASPRASSVRRSTKPPRTRRVRSHLFWKQVRTWYNNHTRIEPSGSEETIEWACRRHAHSFCPVFSTQFCESPTATATTFPPRRRFEPKISLAQTFFAKRSESEAILSNDWASFSQFWKGASQSFCLWEIGRAHV